MARIARYVVPGLPHHVTQRGNRRKRVFFNDADYELYRDPVAMQCGKRGIAVWGYCLAPNHVHPILAPDAARALGRAPGETHRLAAPLPSSKDSPRQPFATRVQNSGRRS